MQAKASTNRSLSLANEIANNMFIASMIRSVLDPSEQNANIVISNDNNNDRHASAHARIITKTRDGAPIQPFAEIISNPPTPDIQAIYDEIDAEIDQMANHLRKQLISLSRSQKEPASTSTSSQPPITNTVTTADATTNTTPPPSRSSSMTSANATTNTNADIDAFDSDLNGQGLPSFTPPLRRDWHAYSEAFAKERFEPPLSEAEEKIYTAIMEETDETMVLVNDDGIGGRYGACTVATMRRLLDDEFINDEIINCYIRLLQVRSDLHLNAVQRIHSPRRRLIEPSPKVHFFLTWFFTKLFELSTGPEDKLYRTYDYNATERYLHGKGSLLYKAGGKTVFDYDLLVFPINVGKSHWILLTIDFRKKKISTYDSLSWNNNPFRQAAARFLCDEYRFQFKKQMDISGWNFVYNEKASLVNITKRYQFDENERRDAMPQQGVTSVNCGVFMLTAADFLSVDALMNTAEGTPLFTDETCSFIRKRIALELYFGRLRNVYGLKQSWDYRIQQGFVRPPEDNNGQKKNKKKL